MNEKPLKKITRIGLGGALIFAGVSHLTFARKDFQAQVPDWVPLKKEGAPWILLFVLPGFWKQTDGIYVI